MALIKCKECGEEISSKAEKCPKCGIKIRKTSTITWVVCGVLLIWFVGKIGSFSESGTGASVVSNENTQQAGVWKIASGDLDVGRYITTSHRIIGTFSNYATENSSLGVQPVISSANDIKFYLYPYNGTNPLKDDGKYGIGYEIGDQISYSEANIWSKYLQLKDKDAQKIHQGLMEGKNIGFYVKKDKSEYSFKITNDSQYPSTFQTLSSVP